jgi:hypothetical protein
MYKWSGLLGKIVALRPASPIGFSIEQPGASSDSANTVHFNADCCTALGCTPGTAIAACYI